MRKPFKQLLAMCSQLTHLVFCQFQFLGHYFKI